MISGSTTLQAAPDYSRGIRKYIPSLGADDHEKSDFVLRACNFYSVYRNRHMARMARNLWYYLGRQWVHLDSQILMDSVRGYVFRDASGGRYADRPKPVTNFIGPACDNEISRLTNKEFEFKVNADSNNPKTIAAALLGQSILKHHYKENLLWEDKREEHSQLLVVCGLVGLWSYWDTSISSTTLVGAPEALHCMNPGCDTKLSSPQVHRTMLQAQPVSNSDSIQSINPWAQQEEGDSEDPQPQDDNLGYLTKCPTCPEPYPLAPYKPTKEEAQGGQDFFGRPLGLQVPKGQGQLDVVPGFELFPENGGVGVNPNNMRRVSRARPVDLDWLEERWPDKSDDFRPADPTAMMQVHPILGEWNYLGRYNATLDQDIYDNHMMFYEVCIEPYTEKVTQELLDEASESGQVIQGDLGDYVANDGRYLCMAGDERSLIMLEDGPLYIPYEDHTGVEKKIKRVDCGITRYKRRFGEFWSDGLPDIGISVQNRINAHDSRWIEAFDRMGSPNILVPDDLELRGPEWRDEWGSGKFLTFTRSLDHPDSKPEVMEGHVLPGEAWGARDRDKQDLQDIMNWQRVERGDNPKNVKNTSQLKLLGDNADAHRGPVERSISFAITKTAKHQLHMLYALRTEEDFYKHDAKGAKSTEIKYFRGEDIQGQYNVEVNAKPGVEGDIYTSEAASEALQEQVYDLSDPVARSRYLELRGLPEINEKVNAQIKSAQDFGIDFSDNLIVYCCDPTLQEPGIFYNVLGHFWLTDDNIKSLQVSVQWNTSIIGKLAGWDKELLERQAQDTVARQYYKGIPQDKVQQFHDQQAKVVEQGMLQYKLAAEQAHKLGGQVPPAPPLQMPPPPTFLTPAIEDQVYQLWCEMLNFTPPGSVDPTMVQAGVQQQPDDVTLALDILMKFRSRIEAYRLYSEKKQLMQAQGAPTTSAPVDQAGPQPQAGGGEAQSKPANQQGQQMPTGPLG